MELKNLFVTNFYFIFVQKPYSKDSAQHCGKRRKNGRLVAMGQYKISLKRNSYFYFQFMDKVETRKCVCTLVESFILKILKIKHFFFNENIIWRI